MNTLIWIPCHKYEQYLPEVLLAAHTQTVQCPVVVAHDACTGGVPRGLSATRNQVLSGGYIISHHYVVFLDADDTIPSNYVEELERVADGDECVVCCPAELFGEQGGRIIPTVPVTKESLMNGNTIHCAALIPLLALREVGGYDETLNAWEDWEMWFRLQRAGVEFRCTDKTHLNYRRHSDSMNFKYSDTVEVMRDRLRKIYG